MALTKVIGAGLGAVSSADLDGAVTINESSADKDFRVESDGNTHALFVEGSSNNVGIGNSDPTTTVTKFGGSAQGLAVKAGQPVIAVEDTSNAQYVAYLGQSETNSYIGAIGGGSLIIQTGTSGSERARILGPSTGHSGYFKVSDDGTYRDSTGTFHEYRSSNSGNPNIAAQSHHASYAGGIIHLIATRASSGSDYTFIDCYSNNAADREFKINSDGAVHADGSFSSTGADYAEMFEWKDGNTSSEDRVGKTVVLDGNQIRLSTSDDAQATIIGVVSARPVVLGDAQDEKWIGKYETDSYGRYVFEEYTQTEWTVEVEDGAKETKSYQTDMIPSDVTVPDDAIVTSKDKNGDKLTRRKLNSTFDESKTYVSRLKRKEFSAVGLVGKLRVNVGQTVGDRWIKMREISDTVHEYLVR